MNKKVKSYLEVKANTWVQPVKKNYRMACCDCCLVHSLDFRIVKNRIQFRARRNNISTNRLRKRENIIIKTKRCEVRPVRRGRR